jgi:hypothetical protein
MDSFQKLFESIDNIKYDDTWNHIYEYDGYKLLIDYSKIRYEYDANLITKLLKKGILRYIKV